MAFFLFKTNEDFLSLDGDNENGKVSFDNNTSFKAKSIRNDDNNGSSDKSKENGKEMILDKDFALSLNNVNSNNSKPIFINEQNELSFNDIDNKNDSDNIQNQ